MLDYGSVFIDQPDVLHTADSYEWMLQIYASN